jgi:HK97 family phage major capsid protein
MRIKELREQMARIATNARAKLNEIADDTPAERAAEIEREFDAMMAEHDAIAARAERMERLQTAEARTRAPNPMRPGEGFDAAPAADEGPAVDYRDAFYAMLRAGGAVADLSAEERAALRGGRQEFRAQTAGTTTAGGFTVPVTLANEIVKAMAAWGPMYDEDISTTINTTAGEQINIPTVDDTSKTASASPKTEGAALTDDGSEDVVFGQARLDAFVFDTEFIKFSMELAQDSIFNMESLLGSLLGERLGRRANIELTTGSGTSRPAGVVTRSTLGRTAAAVAAITGDEIIDLLHSVNPAYRSSPKARFMFNDSTFAAIRKLKDGQGNYLWQMGDVTTGAPGTLLGYRYSINQAMASLATGQRVMVFGDFSKYYVRKVGEAVIGVMRERFWPDLGIAGLIRFDGELVDTAAVKHLITA